MPSSVKVSRLARLKLTLTGCVSCSQGHSSDSHPSSTCCEQEKKVRNNKNKILVRCLINISLYSLKIYNIKIQPPFYGPFHPKNRVAFQGEFILRNNKFMFLILFRFSLYINDVFR